MCTITIINRLFGFTSSATAQLEQETAKASVRFVIFLVMPELLNETSLTYPDRTMKTLIILPYCPQITQGDSDKCLCDTLHVVVILLDFIVAA